MMRNVLKIFFCLTWNIIVNGAPVAKESEATITKYEYNLTDNGYVFEYQTSNGINRREIGEYVNNAKTNYDNDEDVLLRVSGTYSYIDDQGKTQSFKYQADENGYSIQMPKKVAFAVPASSYGFSLSESGQLSPQNSRGISTAALASLSG